MKAEKLKCLRCGEGMRYIMTEDIQLGKHGIIFGDLPHLLSGGLEVVIYRCPNCGKLEFFHSGYEEDELLPQKKCPNCGKEHDFDYPRCPFCNHAYNL